MNLSTSKHFVIGLGTGRCGTASLAKLLSAQPGVHVGHEQAPRIPWDPAPADEKRALRWLQAQPGLLAGDVAHAWISLMPQLADHLNVSCVALCRPVQETVESFCRHMPAEYIQSDRPHGAVQFPTYDLPVRQAWRRYVEQYYLCLRALSQHVTTLPMRHLNSENGQRRILRAAGIPVEQHQYLDECHENPSVQIS